MLSVFGLMGQHLSIVRFFSTNSLVEYNWKPYLVKLFFTGSVIALAGNIIAGIIYNFDVSMLIASFVLTSCTVIQEYCAAIFRAQQKYYLSLIIGQLLPVIFILILSLILLTSVFSFKLLILFYVLSALLYSIFSTYITFLLLPEGHQDIPKEVKRQGYLLFGVGITFVLFNQADVMLVAGLIDMQSLAIYTVILSVMRFYDFGSMALNHVLVPKMKSLTGEQLKQAFYNVLLFGLTITIIYLVLGKRAVEVMYKGQYNSGSLLIPIFCLAGIFKLLYAIPSALIAAIGSESVLKVFLYINIVAVVINYSTNIYLISIKGIIGAGIGAAIAWLIRTIGAFILSHYLIEPKKTTDNPDNAIMTDNEQEKY